MLFCVFLRETFDNISQFNCLMRFVGDPSQSHNFKVFQRYRVEIMVEALHAHLTASPLAMLPG